MTDVQRCDGCGEIRFSHASEYSLGRRVADPSTDEDAVDVRREGDLCVECGREVAELINELGE